MVRLFHRIFRGGAQWLQGLALALAGACSALLAGPLQADPGTTYTLGIVPQFEQRKLFATWKPIADELARRTGLEIRLVVALTVPEFEGALARGSYDFVYANPFHILRVRDSQGYIPLVRDRDPLRGILVVRRGSPVTSVQALAGKSLAVPSPNSLGASLLLRADLERLFGVHMTMVNAGNHSSAYLHALDGLADAAGGVQKTLAEQAPGVRENLRVIYTTRPMPSHPVAAHPRVPRDVRERVRKALLDMAMTPAGRASLAEVPMPFPVSASMDDYLVMKNWGLNAYWVDEGK